MLLIKNKPIRMIAGFLETASLLGLKLWMKNPAEARSFPGRIFREYMHLRRNGRWRACSIDEFVPGARECELRLLHADGEGVFTPVDELAYLAILSRRLQPRVIFEIGTYRGRTAINFALNSPDDCIVYTLDLPPETRDAVLAAVHPADANLIRYSQPGLLFNGRPESKKIRQLWGNSLEFDFSPYTSAVDLVFIDGSHHYAAALSDTRAALQMVRPGGVVVWHDFANYGDYNDVTRAVLDTLPGDEVFQLGSTQLAAYRKPPR